MCEVAKGESPENFSRLEGVQESTYENLLILTHDLDALAKDLPEKTGKDLRTADLLLSSSLFINLEFSSCSKRDLDKFISEIANDFIHFLEMSMDESLFTLPVININLVGECQCVDCERIQTLEFVILSLCIVSGK
jgi:hypothetical protein